MTVVLKSFQAEAVDQLVYEIAAARREATRKHQAVTLSSATGSGKTVIATEVIESILRGTDEVGPDPDAAFLWITDQPELNEQTQNKMAATASAALKLVVIDPTFDKPRFEGGHVYFLNTQKLGKRSGYVVSETDIRTYSLWETITNTVEEAPKRFVVIIDEAHRGMQEGAERDEANTIIQKFIKGSEGEIPPIPLIFGISATIDRFDALLAGTDRNRRPVVVPIDDVRASGLLKEMVNLHHPDKGDKADLTMLRAAARRWRDYRDRWAAYGADRPDEVRPVFVVQVRDASTKGHGVSATPLKEVIRVLKDELGDPPDSWFAHAFQEGATLQLGPTEIRYLAPSAIDADPDVRVVLFKTSLNTGWDCPRAEVMMSFRSSREYVHIAQLVGRMVRAPLAHRIDTDEVLNTVTLYLPHYNRNALKQVIDRLSRDVPATDFEEGELVTLQRVPRKANVFELLGTRPSYIVPRKPNANQVRRLGRLATLLSAEGLRPDAPDEAQALLVGVLTDEFRKRGRTKAFRDVVKEGGSISVRVVSWEYDPDTTDESFETMEISDENVEELFRWADRQFAENLGKAYWKKRAPRQKDHRRSKLEAYALAATPEVLDRLHQTAQTKTREWLSEYSPELSKLTDDAAERLDEVRGLALDPELVPSRTMPTDIQVRPADDTWDRHVFIDSDGRLPAKLTTWEQIAVKEELAKRPVGWLRNLPNKRWSLCVPYEGPGSLQRGLYPDFVFVRRVSGKLVADIIDPHLTALDDAWRKAKGMAMFAQRHGASFGRIELIQVVDGATKRVDLMDEDKRKRVLGVSSNDHLRDIFLGV